MNYGYGPASAWPYTNPNWPSGWGGFAGYGGNPWLGGGYGTLPYALPYLPITGAKRDDAEIKYFVENAIDNDPVIPAHADISVAVQNGVVTLTGTVPNKRIKHAAGDDAWWVPPVLDVHNEIKVVPRRQRVAESEAAETGPTVSRRTQATGRSMRTEEN